MEKPDERRRQRVSEKSKLERYIHELRIIWKIFQDLNWGDAADDYYSRIMDTQLDIKRIYADSAMKKRGVRVATVSGIAGFWLEKIVYQKVFGWGVRMRNVFLAVAVTFSASFYSIV